MSYHHSTCTGRCIGDTTGEVARPGLIGPARLVELIGEEMTALAAARHRHLTAIREVSATSTVIVDTTLAASDRILTASLTGLEESLVALESDFTRRYTGHLTDTTH